MNLKSLSILVILLFELSHAACPNGCTKNGRCTTSNVCVCNEAWTGHDCSIRKCPVGKSWGTVSSTDVAHALVECSGKGHCVQGECKCQQGFQGNACQLVACPEKCGGRGDCLTMEHMAESVPLAMQHHDGSPYAYNANWDHDMIQACSCDFPYMGPDCAQKNCPTGDDPLTTGQTEEIQYIECATTYPDQEVKLNFDVAPTSGTFILRYGAEYSRPIGHDALTGDMQTALNALDGISASTVTKSSTATDRTWAVAFPGSNPQSNVLIPQWKKSEQQSFFCAADGGKFSLTYGTEDPIADIDFDATAASLKAQLEAFTQIGTVTVGLSTGVALCSAAGTTVTITFDVVLDSNYLNGNLPELQFDQTNNNVFPLTLSTGSGFIDAMATEVVRGIDTCRVPEKQTVFCAATTGYFSITFDGATVSNLAFNAKTSELVEKLKTIASVLDVVVEFSNGNAACSSDGNTITITFQVLTTLGPNSDGDVAEIAVDPTNGANSPLEHTVNANLVMANTFTELQKGAYCTAIDSTYTVNPLNQLERSIVSGGGTFKLSFLGKMTRSIPAHASADEVKSALKLLHPINDVQISFSSTDACAFPANVMTVNFTENFGNVPTLVATSTELSIGSTISVKASGALSGSLISKDGSKENLVCSGRGKCNTNIGACECFPLYSSRNNRENDCGVAAPEINNCPGDIPCTGHGVCSGAPNYKCTCAQGWQGGDCSERICPTGKSWFSYPSAPNVAHFDYVECSAVGTCDRVLGRCICHKPFTGIACDTMSCADSTMPCSGHGQCMTLSQIAPLMRSNGVPAGFTYGANPNEASTWDSKQVRSCFCDEGYAGYDCALRECPHGDDPSTEGGLSEIQVLQCAATSGSFTLTFRGETTAAISYDSVSATVKSALEALTNIGTVAITYSAGVSACSTTGVVISVSFDSNLGDLPALEYSISALADNVGGDGSLGSGSISVATNGAILGAVTSVAGTKEDAVCSNHGTCEYSTGICQCDAQYTSSDGYGAEGSRGDCGFHYVSDTPQNNDRINVPITPNDFSVLIGDDDVYEVEVEDADYHKNIHYELRNEVYEDVIEDL